VTDDTLRVLSLCGSLREGSFNRLALRATEALAPAGMQFDTFADLGRLPLFNQDEEKDPSPVLADFKRRIRAADAVLIATPEYNYSIPGVLKNAIDCASRPYGDSAWDGKPVAILGASVGAIGTARAQYHLRQCFVFLNMYAVNQPEVMIGNAPQRFDAAGALTDETTKKLLRALLESLASLTRTLRAGRAALASR
jgi:chromate reductase